MVLENITPRRFDLGGDNLPEIVVLQSHDRLGTQPAVDRIAECVPHIEEVAPTPFVGRPN